MTVKIIDGKRYNTETAEMIASWGSRYCLSDFNYYEEDLYKTPKGAWFLCGSGGPMSKYAVSCGNNSWSGSSQEITLLTEAEAQEWCEAHDVDDETISEHFSIEDA